MEIDKLPENVKRIDVFRVEYGKRKMCNCLGRRYEIDYQNKLVYCIDCGAIVDPFTALVDIGRRYERIAEQTEALFDIGLPPLCRVL